MGPEDEEKRLNSYQSQENLQNENIESRDQINVAYFDEGNKMFDSIKGNTQNFQTPTNQFRNSNFSNASFGTMNEKNPLNLLATVKGKGQQWTSR